MRCYAMQQCYLPGPLGSKLLIPLVHALSVTMIFSGNCGIISASSLWFRQPPLNMVGGRIQEKLPLNSL